MVYAARRELKRGANVVRFEIGVLGKDLFVAHPGSKQIQNVAHPETQAPDAGTPAALSGLRRDARKQIAQRRVHSTAGPLTQSAPPVVLLINEGGARTEGGASLNDSIQPGGFGFDL